MTTPGMTGRRIALTLCVISAWTAWGQSRLNDKDLEKLMRNLRDDAKAFRSPFSAGLKRSSIRKTSQARDAERLSELFAKETESLLNNFKDTKKGDAKLTDVQSSGQQLNNIVRSYQLGPQVATAWDRIQGELSQVLSAYGIDQNTAAFDNPRGISTGVDVNGPACSQAVGRERADRLVQECLQVSPATRPPCNVANSCVLIIDEIKRGCNLLDARDRPAFCGEYK